MKYLDIRKRLLAVDKLLREEATSRSKFESMRTLIKGIDPKVDKSLAEISQVIKTVEKIQEGEIIDLGLKSMPAKTEKEKKRKKALLLLIKRWKQLKAEIKRVQKEIDAIEPSDSKLDKVERGTRIVAKAKGPFGVITLAAVAIVAGGLIFNNLINQTSETAVQQPEENINESDAAKIKVLVVGDKQISLSEVAVFPADVCGSEHYHALDHKQAKAVDGTVIPDPGGCGFGKVSEVTIIEVPVVDTMQ